MPGFYSTLVTEAQRAISHQEANLDTLRIKTGTVLGAALIVASFFAPHVLGRRDVGFSAAVAIGVTVLTLGSGVVVLLPWSFTFWPSTLHDWVNEVDYNPRAKQAAAERNDKDLALVLYTYLTDNKPVIQKLTYCYGTAVAGLIAEGLAWGIDRAIHG